MNDLVLFSRYSPERSLHSRPLEQEDRGKEQKGTAGGGSSSHRNSDTLTHEQTVQAQGEATAKLREIALRHGFLTGKWYCAFLYSSLLPPHLTTVYPSRLVFTSPDKVDAIWNRLARRCPGTRAAGCRRLLLSDSLVSGPLAQTSAFLSKVSTTPKSSEQHYQHVICVYLPNVFDKDEVTKVL